MFLLVTRSHIAGWALKGMCHQGFLITRFEVWRFVSLTDLGRSMGSLFPDHSLVGLTDHFSVPTCAAGRPERRGVERAPRLAPPSTRRGWSGVWADWLSRSASSTFGSIRSMSLWKTASNSGSFVVGVVADDVDGFCGSNRRLGDSRRGLRRPCRGDRSRHGRRGSAREQVVGGLFGGIEIAGVDCVDHGVRRLCQLVAFIVFPGRSWPKTVGTPAPWLRLNGTRSTSGGPRHWPCSTSCISCRCCSGRDHSVRFWPSRQLQFKGRTQCTKAVLADAKFHEQLLVFDRDLAASARAARCWLCGGALHSGIVARPQAAAGCPGGLGQE